MYYVIHNKMKYSNFYKDTLFQDVIPFWEKNSIDSRNGGYFTCLDTEGRIFDTDKFIWLQGRQAWMFSMLYNKVEKNENWLSVAKSGIDFLLKYGRDKSGRFFFSTTAEGKPLVQAYNIFSDCFAAMAFSQYAQATGDDNVKKMAVKTYHNILERRNNPKLQYEKSTGVRPLKGFALPMILSNLVMELEGVLDTEEIENTIDFSVNEVMNVFLDSKSGLVYEFVRPDGSHEDSFNGRLLNPGHGIEAMWFMMDIAKRRNDADLYRKAIKSLINILEFGWDDQYGGIFYFMDIKGFPTEQLEWDQKLWWVHLETLVALAKAWEFEPTSQVINWYKKVHDYTWSHFPDPENGEWFGYLNRQGEVLLQLKGGKWKGCFHVPRAMYQCWKSFEVIEEKYNKDK